MLQQLPKLRLLRLDGRLDESTAGVAAQLTGLQHLALSSATDVGVAQLAALKQLTLLDLSGCAISDRMQQQLTGFELLAPTDLESYALFELCYRPNDDHVTCWGLYNQVRRKRHLTSHLWPNVTMLAIFLVLRCAALAFSPICIPPTQAKLS